MFYILQLQECYCWEKRIGLAEKTGRGIDRIFEGSIVFGRPLPDYSETTSTYVKLFLQRAEPDLAFAKMISNEENRLGRSLPINSLLILSALQNQRRLTIAEIAEVTNIGEIRAKAVVEKLVEAGCFFSNTIILLQRKSFIFM